MRRVATCAALALALPAAAGCGGGDEGERPAATPSAATVTVEVRPDGARGSARNVRLGCPHSMTCRRLRRADLGPVNRKLACTQVYGGPATARVHGVVGGRAVDARFSLVNGCEIARWKRLAWLLGPPPQ